MNIFIYLPVLAILEIEYSTIHHHNNFYYQQAQKMLLSLSILESIPQDELCSSDPVIPTSDDVLYEETEAETEMKQFHNTEGESTMRPNQK